MDDIPRATLVQLIQQGISSAQAGQEPGNPENIVLAAIGYEAALRSLAGHLGISLDTPKEKD